MFTWDVLVQKYRAVVLSIISDSDTAAAEISFVRWQPDFFAISNTSKNIAIGPEVCRPSYTRAQNMVEAYSRKLQAYHPILVSLKHYIAYGWTIKIIQ